MIPRYAPYWVVTNTVQREGRERWKHPEVTRRFCVPFESEEDYAACMADAEAFRQRLVELQAQHPELFPSEFSGGFALHGAYESAKQRVTVRRIELRSNGEVYQVRPSFLMPYMVARTDEVEKALFLRRFGVSFDALAYVFGRDAMFWYRATMALGRPSLVGSTIKSPERLPLHLAADEKHTKLCRERVYVATTAGSGCILGASTTFSASADELEAAYGEFAAEARELAPSGLGHGTGHHACRGELASPSRGQDKPCPYSATESSWPVR